MSSRDVSEQIAKYGCPYYYSSTAGSLQIPVDWIAQRKLLGFHAG